MSQLQKQLVSFFSFNSWGHREISDQGGGGRNILKPKFKLYLWFLKKKSIMTSKYLAILVKLLLVLWNKLIRNRLQSQTYSARARRFVLHIIKPNISVFSWYMQYFLLKSSKARYSEKISYTQLFFNCCYYIEKIMKENILSTVRDTLEVEMSLRRVVLESYLRFMQQFC